MTGFMAFFGDWWPYALVILVGFLPSEIWRVAAALLSKRISDKSEIFVWVRMVAATLVAAVVAKLVLSPPAALAALPLSGRVGAVALTLGLYFAIRRSVFVAMAGGLGMIVFLAHRYAV